jgi:uncharacterized membrane protein
MKTKQILKLIKIIIFFFLVFFIINIISGYFSERVKNYVSQKAQLEVTNIISDAVTEK